MKMKKLNNSPHNMCRVATQAYCLHSVQIDINNPARASPACERYGRIKILQYVKLR